MAKKDKKKQDELEKQERLDDQDSQDNQDDLNLIENDEEILEEPIKKKRRLGCLFSIIIFALIIGSLVAILGFNVGNIRDKYLRPGLERIPIIRNLLPPIEESEEPVEQDNKNQNEFIQDQEDTIKSLTKEINDLNTEIKRLKEFEANQLKFKEEKEQFDKMIALNDPKAYSIFYEKIAPENADKLYKEVINKNINDKKFKEYIKTFENMKKDAAAKILEELILTDMDLVITILENLSSEKRSEVLSKMDSTNAATVTKLLSPQQQ